METLEKLEKAVEELVALYEEQQERVNALEEELSSLKEGEGRRGDWDKEKKAISKKVSSIIKTIESAGIKLKN